MVRTQTLSDLKVSLFLNPWLSLCLMAFFCFVGCDENSAPTDSDIDADTAEDTDTDADPDDNGDADPDAENDGDETTDAEVDDDEETDADLPFTPEVPDPPDTTPTNESRTRAFQLYYRERVDRALTAYNRFAQFGDANFSTNIYNAYVSRNGSEFEIIPGPCDNNRIGTGPWMAYNAYRIFRSRSLELTLMRQFNGLTYLAEVSGHPGVTSREVYPGWTLAIDGPSGLLNRTRAGVPVDGPAFSDEALQSEILSAFFSDIEVTYRLDPTDFMRNFMPLADLDRYAITVSFFELPDYLRVSDCCSSLMQTPEEYDWAGAFWGNHNSRDNFPDLSLGYIAAFAASRDEDASAEVRAAAQRAVEAGNSVGDLILQNGTALMTVDEHNPYDTLVVSGTVRPDGETESQDLGSFDVCSAAYLAQAISTEGLSSPSPEILLTGSLEQILFEPLDWLIDCEIPKENMCESLSDAWCGLDWSTFHHLELAGTPILEFLRDFPDAAPSLLGAFQDDFDEMVVGILSLLHYAAIIEDEELYEEARSTLFYGTWLMGELADLAYADDPSRRARQRYRAALYQAQGELPAIPEDLDDFSRAEQEMTALEGLLSMADTAPAELLTDEEILARINEELESEPPWLAERYREEYGDSPPVRRSGDGYEARATPVENYPWQPVEHPHHTRIGGIRLFNAITLCERAPQLLDCSWAVLGCSRPDLSDDNTVDAEDRALFDAAREAHPTTTCDETNAWCDGADLDRNGEINDDDDAFMTAATGCYYDVR